MNAIILAAGMGTRLRPLTNYTPKALVKVNGEPIIEKQIKYLKDIGIEDITIVTGYLNQKFDYLVDKYGVKTIFNDKYDVYNNGYTMYLVKDILQNSYVLEGDVYLTRNFLQTDINESTYFAGKKENFINEWVLEFNNLNEVTNIKIDSGTDYIMSGVSYWTTEDGRMIKTKLEEIVENNSFENLFWDDLVKDNLQDFNIKISLIESTDWFEIDSIIDLEKAEGYEKRRVYQNPEV